MALTALASKVFTLAPVQVSSGCYGVVSQSDGSYVAGLSETSLDFPFPTSSFWYRSIDQGRTWSLQGSTVGIYGQTQYFPSNIRAGNIVAPAITPATNAAMIQRSINGGISWSTVYGPVGPTPMFGRDVYILGCQSHQRTKALAWGALDGDNRDPPKTWATSDDAGASWDVHESWDIGNAEDICNAMGIAENGTIYAQYTKRGGLLRTSHFARSDNFGSTWTTLGTPPGGTGTPPNAGHAITCLSPSKMIMAGRGSTTPTSSQPWVWYSHDSGSTLTRLSSGDIASFPSGSFNTWAFEVKRLTREAVWLSIEQQNGSPGSPWRISLDEGETFPIVVANAGGGWAPYQIPFGKVAVTPDGGVLSCLWSSDDYEAVRLEIWRTQLTC